MRYVEVYRFSSLYLHKKVGTAFAAPTFFVEIIPQTARKVSARVERYVPHYRGDYEFSILTGDTFTFKTVSPLSLCDSPSEAR